MIASAARPSAHAARACNAVKNASANRSAATSCASPCCSNRITNCRSRDAHVGELDGTGSSPWATTALAKTHAAVRSDKQTNLDALRVDMCCSLVAGAGKRCLVRSIGARKDECHVVDVRYRKLGIDVHFRNVYAGGLDGVDIRFSTRPGQQRQRHAEPDHEN